MDFFTKWKNSSGSQSNMCRNDKNKSMESCDVCWPIPMKAIGAQNLLTLYGGVTFSGYLHKKGGTQLISKWPLRFIVIHKGCIYYFKSSSSTSPQGAFSLSGYNRVMRAAEETTSSNVFPFKIVHISKNHRTWYFSAASEDERKQWMLSLRKEIDYYHERQESISSMSDSSSDTDSFYGSLERPIDIRYSPHGTDSEDESDYEEPDSNDDASPPDYPPPAVPDTSLHTINPSRRTSECPLTLQQHHRKPALPDVPLQQPKGLLSASGKRSGELSPGVPRPPVAALTANKPPPPPLPQLKKLVERGASGESIGPLKPTAPVKPPKSPALKDISTELQSKLEKIQPPSIPLHLPPVPNKPKPSVVNKTVAPPPRPKVDHVKPTLYKPNLVPKPPEKKPPLLPVKPDIMKSSASQLQRASPDGQSFKGVLQEMPGNGRQKRSDSLTKDVVEDDEDDYEHPQLPETVFVNKTGSYEVESIFKENFPKGIPDGLYCIRKSGSKSGQVFVVWDQPENKVRNYRIFEMGSKVYLGEELKFTDLGSLVEFYCKNTLPNHDRLRLQLPFGYTPPSR
ncbi:SH3 domain-binding protein 2 isoform X2 [Protopterus annectens]|uniref:SH3 domain-binding protein 2 isoform X2 n=1 Tax=Protopterus annectens TaxID=7888 RepID=UPI001CFC0849|nr:SH3 domain-binding protein 2 isoform X2 [Protopterus annectens]